MEVYGFSVLDVSKTPAGSLVLRQEMSLPLEEAFSAAPPLANIGELGWRVSGDRAFVGAASSRAAVYEVLEQMTMRRATELMMDCQAIGNPRLIEEARRAIGLNSRDMIIPYQETQEAKKRWILLADQLLKSSEDLLADLKKMSWVGEASAAARWLKQNTRTLGEGRRLPVASQHGLNLISPDFSRQVVLSGKPPWTAIEVKGKRAFREFTDRESMLEWARGRLDGEPGSAKTIVSYLRDGWKGQPIDARAVDPSVSIRPRLSLSPLMRPSEKGYIKKAAGGLSDTARRKITPRTLPSGFFHPGLRPVTGRPEMPGLVDIKAPVGVYGR